MAGGTQSTSRNCVSCGRGIAWDANVCTYCGHDFRGVMERRPPEPEDSGLPLIGGILILVAGLIEMASGAVLMVGGSLLFGLTLGGSGWLAMCGVVLVVVGLVAVVGGMFAMQRRNYALAIVGGVLSIGGSLGLIGLILVAVSKDEFED